MPDLHYYMGGVYRKVAVENAACKKSPESRHLGTIPQLCRAISSQLRHVSTVGKNLLSTNISPICPHNMVNMAY